MKVSTRNREGGPENESEKGQLIIINILIGVR